MTALVGTGLATLAVSLTGVAGLSSDLQAAALKDKTTAPVLTPGEELQDTKGNDSRGLVLRDACDKSKKKHHGASTVDGVSTKTAPAPAATTPSAREF